MAVLHRRIGRLGYAIGSIPVYALLIFIFWSEPSHRWSLEGHLDRVPIVLALLAWDTCLSAWRCHDFGKPLSWDFWTNQIPIVGGLISLWELHFKPGDTTRNAYGHVPKI
jgi:uncharacterized membrane protein YhaH (DUF805 family)